MTRHVANCPRCRTRRRADRGACSVRLRQQAGSRLPGVGRRRHARQPAGLCRQRRRPRVLRDRFLGTHPAGALDARQAGAVAGSSTATTPSPSKATPTSAARANTTSRSAPVAPRRCGTISPPAASRSRACARSPTARNGRSRSATTSRAGRRTAARLRCSAPPRKPLRTATPSHRRPAGRRFAFGAMHEKSHFGLDRPGMLNDRRQLDHFRHDQPDVSWAHGGGLGRRTLRLDRDLRAGRRLAARRARPHVRHAISRPRRRRPRARISTRRHPPSRCCASSGSKRRSAR